MEENFKNKFGFFTFILIVLGLAVGGYFYMNYTIKDVKMGKDKTKEEVTDYKVDKDKDFIYYKDEETISEEGEIYYKNVVINLSTQEVLNELLEKENKIYKDNIKYRSDVSIPTEEIINYDYDNLYSLTFREYKDYTYNNYVSLLVNDFSFSCFDDITFKDTKAYVFDTKTGKSLTKEEILSIYSLSMDDVKNKMREYLTGKQSTVDGTEAIKIDETVNNLDNYSIYINEFGHLYITYLVKTTQVDYNENMEVK